MQFIFCKIFLLRNLMNWLHFFPSHLDASFRTTKNSALFLQGKRQQRLCSYNISVLRLATFLPLSSPAIPHTLTSCRMYSKWTCAAFHKLAWINPAEPEVLSPTHYTVHTCKYGIAFTSFNSFGEPQRWKKEVHYSEWGLWMCPKLTP